MYENKEMKLVSDSVSYSFHRSLPAICLAQVGYRKINVHLHLSIALSCPFHNFYLFMVFEEVDQMKPRLLMGTQLKSHS